jgi:CO/xanthine dehydrogenase FAD-binding subunit
VTVTSYFLPTSVLEAIGLLRAHGPDLLVIAGGTVAMPLINEGISLPTHVMGLRRAGLDTIERTPGGLRIGATATLTAIAALDAVPLLATAARRTASWSVRNMATVGGNLFTPPPGGDLATALLALDATVEATGPDGTRTIPLAAFFTGFLATALEPDELVTAITVPAPATAEASAYRKLGRRQANSPAVVMVAVRARLDGGIVTDARLALGAVGPHPIRVPGAEAALDGSSLDTAAIDAAAEAATAAAEPLEDAVASDWYRRRMTGIVVRRVLEELAATGIGRAA